MPVIDTEQGLRKMADDPARRVRADQGVPLASGGTLTATNVQDAIDQLAANAGGGGGIADAPSDGNLYARKNATWAVVPPAAAPVAISDTAPSSPAAGNLWWDSANGELYIYYNDGSSSQWVAITTAQAIGSGSGGGGGGAGSFTTNIVGAGTYIVPSGKTTLVGEAWGAGGSGGGYLSTGNNGAGGGGYSKFSVSVTPGQTIYYSVGAAGASANGDGSNGNPSWVNPSANSSPTTTGCVGGGGGGGGASGVGGGGSGTVGSTNFSGGNGAAGGGSAGGGGGAAGSAGNGSAASGSTGGAGGTPNGGAGGNGIVGAFGVAGTTPGGGGGAAKNSANNSGAGGNGQVRLTFS